MYIHHIPLHPCTEHAIYFRQSQSSPNPHRICKAEPDIAVCSLYPFVRYAMQYSQKPDMSFSLPKILHPSHAPYLCATLNGRLYNQPQYRTNSRILKAHYSSSDLGRRGGAGMLITVNPSLLLGETGVRLEFGLACELGWLFLCSSTDEPSPDRSCSGDVTKDIAPRWVIECLDRSSGV